MSSGDQRGKRALVRLVASAIATALFGLLAFASYIWNLSRAFAAVSEAGVDPSQKARILAEGISGAMKIGAVFVALSGLSIVAMILYGIAYLVATRRPENGA